MSALELIRGATTPTIAGDVEGFHVRLAIKLGPNGPVIDVSLSADQAACVSDLLRNLALRAAEKHAAALRDRAEALEQHAEDVNARRG